MNTDQLLEALKELPLMNRWVIFPKVKEYYEVEKKQMEAILSLLSQQAVVVESDEEAFREALKWAGGFSIKHSLYRFLFDAGCTHVRQQLSKEQQQREEVMKEIIQFTKDMLVFTRNFYREETVTYIKQLLTRYNNHPKTTHP